MAKKAARARVWESKGVLSLVPEFYVEEGCQGVLSLVTKFYGEESCEDNDMAKSRGTESVTRILCRRRLQGQQCCKIKGC